MTKANLSPSGLLAISSCPLKDSFCYLFSFLHPKVLESPLHPIPYSGYDPISLHPSQANFWKICLYTLALLCLLPFALEPTFSGLNLTITNPHFSLGHSQPLSSRSWAPSASLHITQAAGNIPQCSLLPTPPHTFLLSFSDRALCGLPLIPLFQLSIWVSTP